MNGFKRVLAAFLIAAPASMQLPTLASSQSFSCANAQIPSEMAICNSENLLVKDEEVAELVSARLVKAVSSGDVPKLSREHSNWLRVRNECANDIPCLESVYDKRIRNLTGREL